MKTGPERMGVIAGGEAAGMKTKHQIETVALRIGNAQLSGELCVPENAAGLVLFAHGSGSSRRSPRNQYVARVLQDAGIGTLLFDLLTPGEEQDEYFTRHLRFDVAMLGERLVSAARWAREHPAVGQLDFGFFGASTGAAAAVIAAAQLGEGVRSVVSRGGRPDLAGDALPGVRAATLFIVGSEDHPVLELNRQAFARLGAEKEMQIVPGATHLFEEAGALEQVAELAARWFQRHFQSAENFV